MRLVRFVRGFFLPFWRVPQNIAFEGFFWFLERSPVDRLIDTVTGWRAWTVLACRLRGHAKRHRSLMVQGRLYTWSTCRRCGRHLSGEQPPWGELLSRAVNRRMVTR